MSGELKHGPLAMVDKDLPVIIIAPRDNTHKVSRKRNVGYKEHFTYSIFFLT